MVASARETVSSGATFWSTTEDADDAVVDSRIIPVPAAAGSMGSIASGVGWRVRFEAVDQRHALYVLLVRCTTTIRGDWRRPDEDLKRTREPCS
jgi:hypothetical protein